MLVKSTQIYQMDFRHLKFCSNRKYLGAFLTVKREQQFYLNSKILGFIHAKFEFKIIYDQIKQRVFVLLWRISKANDCENKYSNQFFKKLKQV